MRRDERVSRTIETDSLSGEEGGDEEWRERKGNGIDV